MLHKAVQKNTILAWIAAGIAILLLIPLVAMQFTANIQWTAFDFVAMGVFLLTFASMLVIAARKTTKMQLPVVILTIAFLACYVWAELAVGIFFTLGN
jgi:hypothetical protein